MIRLVIQLFQKLTSKSWDDIFHSWRWIMGYTRRYWVQVAIYTLITVSGTVLSLISSIVSKNLIDAVTGYNSGSIGWAAAAYAGLGFSNIFINMISGKISLLITTKVSQELREEIFTKLIYTDWESISKYTSGELMVRLGGDTGNIANSILTFLPVAIRSLINFGGAFIIICQHDPWMALIALLGAPVTFLTSRYRMEKMTAFQKENQKMQGRSMTFHQETIRNLQSIKAFGVLEYFVDGYAGSVLASVPLPGLDRRSYVLCLLSSKLRLLRLCGLPPVAGRYQLRHHDTVCVSGRLFKRLLPECHLSDSYHDPHQHQCRALIGNPSVRQRRQ